MRLAGAYYKPTIDMHITEIFTRHRWAATWLGILTIALCYQATWASLGGRWNTRGEAYSHGWLLLAIALGLALQQRKAFLKQTYSFSGVALALLFASSLFWLIGDLSEIGIFCQLTLPAIPFLWIASVNGWGAARTLWFPCAILYTVIPLWDFLLPALQDMTVWVSGSMLHWVEVPAFISERFIELPAGVLEVAEGCAGLSYLLIGITLSAFYAHFAKLPIARTIAALVLGATLGLITNWVRVFAIALIAHQSNMQSSIVHDHEFFGWLVFAGSMVPYFYFLRKLESTQAPSAGSNAGSADPSDEKLGSNASAARPHPLALLAPLTLLVSFPGPIISASFSLQAIPVVTLSLPDVLAEARAIPTNTEANGRKNPIWAPDYQGADIIRQRSYRTLGGIATVHAVIYTSQQQKKKLLGWGNQLVAEDAWIVQRRDHAQGLQVTEISARFGSVRYRIFSWYQLGERTAESAARARIDQLLARLQGRQDASLFAVAFQCRDSSCPSELSQAAWAMSVKNAHLLRVEAQHSN
ncbi:conserved hypothetical protein [gamma proteobacterium HdN1]|nr:conserved hypothetical protein [gamma proteobacterium HdN1]